MLTALALVSLVALAGFISYFGDLQGRRWGKRRVSLFGLRPRHTAVLLTSLTGAFIALFSIATLFAISPAVRTVVLRGETLLRTQRNLIRRQQNQLDVERRQLQQAAHTNAQQAARIADLDMVRGAMTRQVSVLFRKRADLEKRIAADRAQITALTRSEASLQSKNAALVRDNRSYSTDNQQLGRQNIGLMRRNTGLEQALSDKNSALKALDTQVQARSRDVEALQARLVSLQVQENEFRKTIVVLRRDSDALQSENVDLTARNGRLRTDNLSLASQNQQLADLLSGTQQSFSESYLALRSGRVDFRAGELLARRVVAGGMSVDGIMAELGHLMDDASAMALVHGAATGPSGRAVRILPKRIPTELGIEQSSEEDNLRAVADTVAGFVAPSITTVHAVYNSVEGEPVIVELTTAPVITCFEKDQLVAGRRIAAGGQFDDIVTAISNFLQQDVHDSAIRHGVVPQVDPVTGQLKLGGVSASDLLTLADRVRRMGGAVDLVAYAKDAVTSADPLKLDFRLTRARNR